MNIDPERLLLTQPGEDEKLMFQFYKEHPDLAVIDLLKQDLAPFQRKVIKGVADHSYVLSILARGSGKTRMIGMLGAFHCMFNPKMRCGFLAPGFRQAKLAFMEFEAISNESPYLQACIKRVSKQADVWSVEFWNGAFIFALPLVANNPASIRGTRLHAAFIDEFPHVPKDVIDKVITPMLATQLNPMTNVRRIEKEKDFLKRGIIRPDEVTKSAQNKMCGFSSAYFQYNHMYETMLNYKKEAQKEKALYGKTDYAVYHFNYLDGPEGFFDLKTVEYAKANSSSIAFAMEFLSEFPSDSEGFFKRSLLDSCISREPNTFYLKEIGDPKKKYIIGIDPARNDDNFAVAIIELDGELKKLVRVITYTDTAYPEVVMDLRRIFRDFNVILIGMDAGGGGLAIKDLLASSLGADSDSDVILDMEDDLTLGKPGKRILKMVNFAPNWITEANFDMRTSLEHKTLLFPYLIAADTFIKPEADLSDVQDTMKAEFEQTINEIQVIEMTSSKSGNLHFDVPKGNLKKDRYSATLIAHKLAYDYLSTGLRRAELGSGGWLAVGGGLESDDDKEVYWQDTNILTTRTNARSERLGSVTDGSLA